MTAKLQEARQTPLINFVPMSECLFYWLQWGKGRVVPVLRHRGEWKHSSTHS